ncbi:MAG TPA: zinc-binding dehydrogenase, partial [Nocardioidaceae bacterium]|nr:zinc-binding dehydrogenase [Nocardioidaceae bacterium]
DRQLRARAVSAFTSQRLTGLMARERGSDLERLTALVEAGTLAPTLDRTYPLAEVRSAMRLLASGGVRGKVALTP